MVFLIPVAESMNACSGNFVSRLRGVPVRALAVARRRRAGCVLAIGLLVTGAASAKEAVTWIESYDEALAEARRTGKAIFLEFRCAP